MAPIFVLVSASVFMLWVFALIASICIIAALENDSPGWATFTVAATIGILYFFTDFRAHYDVSITWQHAVTFAISYIIIGVLWSLGKWWIELINRRQDWREAEQEYRHKHNLTENAAIDRTNQQFIRFLMDNSNYVKFVRRIDGSTIIGSRPDQYVVKVRPLPNRARNIARMTYWPWSLVWSILDDLIKSIFRAIYNQIAGAYNSMARYAFRGIDD